MKLIYIRYVNTLDILKGNKDINQINIIGVIIAYMDSYNLLLGQLYKTENQISN